MWQCAHREVVHGVCTRQQPRFGRPVLFIARSCGFANAYVYLFLIIDAVMRSITFQKVRKQQRLSRDAW